MYTGGEKKVEAWLIERTVSFDEAAFYLTKTPRKESNGHTITTCVVDRP